MAPILYFAYGSNLHPERLTERVPSARLIGTGVWSGRRLAFHKIGKDGSAKCDAPEATRPTDEVHGAIYELSQSDLERLDRIEGAGTGYDRELVTVLSSSQPVTANVYLARPESIDPDLIPFDWYRLLVLTGARYHGIPKSTLSGIAAVPAVPDPDRARARTSLSSIPELRP
jgi:gamma-glutamylcyclotransferase (GGCT)/AIG2-like uncharacterized protein YtfP